MFFLGISIIVAVISFATLILFGSSTTINPLIPLLAAASLIPCMVGVGWLLNKATPTSTLIQALRILGMTGVGFGMLLSTIILQADRLNITPTTLLYLRSVNNFWSILIWLSLPLSLIAKRKK